MPTLEFMQYQDIFIIIYLLYTSSSYGVVPGKEQISNFEKKILRKIWLKKIFRICVAFVTPRVTMGSLKKFQLIRSSRLASHS